MATLELEPDFVKGLRFMLSSSRDSADSLRTMLDDAIRAKYGTSKSLGSFQHKVKIDEEYTSQILTERNSEDSCSSKEEGEEDLNLDMMEEDLSCTVCGNISVGPRNRLVECCECHSLYHQECHHPAISEQDISDPRNTWYCSCCSATLHRTTEAASTTSSSSSTKQSSSSSSSKSSLSKHSFKSSSQSGTNRSSPTNSKPSSSSRSESSTDKSSLFKRSDKTSSGSPSSSSSSKVAPSGLAALAASLQSSKSSSVSGNNSHKSSSSSSGFTTSSSGSKSSSSSKDNYSSSSKSFNSSGGSSSQSSKNAPSSPTLSGINADRRLQIMKKKAAKMQEKRKHSK